MKRLNYLFLLGIMAITMSCNDVNNSDSNDNETKETLLMPEEFMNPENHPKPSITMVGTFHFDYPDLDAYKTDEDDRIDVLAADRQEEMTQLLDHLARFNPNKIVIESRNAARWNELYREYLDGTLEPMRDERVQLGFALGKRFGLDTMYCLDAGSFAGDYAEEGCTILDTLFKEYDWKSDDPIVAKAQAYLEYRDKALTETSLYDFISSMNTEQMWNFNYGFYLVGDFKLDNFAGVDALALYWYNRNLRIFRKIQMITESPEDRILVIFGNGHVAILNQLFKSSPEYRYTPFQEL